MQQKQFLIWIGCYTSVAIASWMTVPALAQPSPTWGEPGYNWVGDFNGDRQMELLSILPDGTVSFRLYSGEH